MEYELIDRPQHEPDGRRAKHRRGVFIPEEDREADKQDHVPSNMGG